MSLTEARPIKDYCLGIFDGPHATPKEADDGPIFLGIKNITDDGRLDFAEIRHVSEEELLQLISYIKSLGAALPEDRR